MRKTASLTSLIVFLALVACGQITFEEKLNALYRGTVPLIYSDSLSTLINRKDVFIVDTRSKAEFDVSHLSNAMFSDYETFDKSQFAKIPKDTPIVLYCSVGYRSERIGEELLAAGFVNISNLYGGIFEWKNTDHEVVDSQGKSTERVHTYSRNWSQWLKKGIKVYE